jgi:hypothetical protein
VSPASVCNTGTAVEGLLLLGRFQFFDFAIALVNLQFLMVINQRHSRGVVASILQAPESFEQYFRNFAPRGGGHYATHKSVLAAPFAGTVPTFNIALTGAANS